MENNKNTQFLSSERGIFIDPNFGNENVQVENLSIEVDLSVYERTRSLIKVEENAKDEDNEKLIATMRGGSGSFNEGKKFGENRYSLTTSYTEVADIDYDGKETLGITNVEIEFNASYMPMITMELTDVRGKLFQTGKESPYKAFFNFPYPMFELKVKGFFGKPVTYLLHLTKFNTKLESGSGNFKIQCNFIGYTYAYLSDMLLGYLKAIPHTQIGRRLIEKKGPNFITFKQLYEYSNRLQDKITKFKQGDEVKALTKAYEVVNIYQDILNKINKSLLDVDQMNYDTENVENKIVFIMSRNAANNNIIYQTLAQLKAEVEEINQTIINGDNYDLNPNLFQLQTGYNHFRELEKKHFIDETNDILDTYGGTIYQFNPQDFRFIASKLRNISDIKEEKFEVVFLGDLVEHIRGKSEALNKVIIEKKNIFAMNKIDDMTTVMLNDTQGNQREFDFNIYNYTKILCDHVDLLMEAIEEVAREAEDDKIRNEDLKRDADKMYDIVRVNDLAKIYAFPDYKTKKDSNKSVFSDTWIGKEHADIHEAVFVRDLYNGLIESKRLDDKWHEELLNENPTQWYGVNPFDSGLFTHNKNIWESVNHSNGEDGKIIRLMALRALTFLNVTVRKPSQDEINVMAKLEANNIFNLIEDDSTKRIISMIGNDLDPEKIVEAVRKQIEKGNHNFENDLSSYNKNAIVTEDRVNTEGIGDFEWGSEGLTEMEDYIYIGTHDTVQTPEEMVLDGQLLPGFRTYIPLYFSGNTDGFDGNRIITGKNGFTDHDERKELREEGTIFFSDYIGPVGIGDKRPDDGATFIEFKSEEEYMKPIDSPAYGQEILTDSKIDNKKVFSKSELMGLKREGGDLSNVLFNGKYGSLELMNYTHNGETYSFNNYFYRDETSLKRIPELVFQTMRNNWYEPREFPIFGSYLYYQQKSRYGRALLFLETLPFKLRNMGNFDFELVDNDMFPYEILSLFSHKAANIKVPYAWILRTGGVLYRHKIEEIWEFEKKEGYKITPQEVDGPARDERVFLGEKVGIDKRNIITRVFRDRDLMPNTDNEVIVSMALGMHQNDPFYEKLDEVLLKLPDSVKDKFIHEFKTWVDSEDGFAVIQDYMEIFDNEGSTGVVDTEKMVRLWGTYEEGQSIPLNGSVSSLRKNLGRTYKHLSVNDQNWDLLGDTPRQRLNKWREGDGNLMGDVVPAIFNDGGGVFNFNPTIDANSDGANYLMAFLNDSRILVNGTWRVWVNDEALVPFLDFGRNSETLEGSSLPFTTKKENLNTYVKSFIKEFIRLTEKENAAENSIQNDIFNNTNLEDIYLTIYKNIKSIYDKWITGRDRKMVTYDNLIETFKFIDRGYNDIGEEFKLNPNNVTDLLTSSYNNSFYSHISKVLTNNDFDFIPLPNFVDLDSKSEMLSLFKPYDYNAQVGTVKASFVCMYGGEKSNRLDGNEDYKDDSFDVMDTESLPEDFNQVPGIFVNYGDENQSIFTSIELDQTEFSETNESILTTDQIASSYNNVNTVGQNLFDVYNNRAYNATVGLLGNAMMQPFMYFQLNNIPMFRGAYVITSVNHSIQPNHMTTSIKGNRVKRVKTELIDKETIFYNLLGVFGDIQSSDGNLEDLDKIGTGNSGKTSTKPDSNSGPKAIITRDTGMEDIYNNSFFPYNGFNPSVFEKESNTKYKNGKKMTFNQIFSEVSKLSGVPVLTLQVMSAMESAGGQNKGGGYGINGSGYVGVMQMGQGATLTAIGYGFEEKLFTVADKYHFHAEIDMANQKLKLPPKRTNEDGSKSEMHWEKSPTVNNLQTNSLFDDFINVLGGAYYVIANKKYNQGSPYKNVAHIYMAHQQGGGGINSMFDEPNTPISSNMRNNLSPYLKTVDTSQLVKSQFFMSWAGHVEATAYAIDRKYDCPTAGVNKKDIPELAKRWA